MNTDKIGKFIAVCRKKQKLTQEQLAEKLNITDRAVSKWERGLSLPDVSIMLELCNILGISVNELMLGEEIDKNDYNEKTEKLLLELAKQDKENNKRIGLGSISLLLVIIAFFWSFEINSFCLGDSVLATLNLPTWSDGANASGIHYTIFYSLIFLIPALFLSIKYKNNLYSKISKWLSIFFIGLLVLGITFMII